MPDEKAQYWNGATIGQAGWGVNEVQLTVYGYPTTGTFTLSFNGRGTGPISDHPTAGEIEDTLTRLIGMGRNDVPVADLGNWMYQIRVSGWTSKFCSIFREAENVSCETSAVSITEPHQYQSPAPSETPTRRM